MILNACLFALWATASAAEGGPAESSFPYPVQHRSLENGLDIYLVPMESPGVVAYYSWVAVGSRDEVDPGRTGFAHFFEHLMFHGTESMGPDEREKLLVGMGTEENAWTWLDETVYHALLSTTHLQRHIEIEADRFQHLSLTADGVRREAGAVYGEFRGAIADPEFRLSEAIHATAFTTHTYGHETIGIEADIDAMPGAFDYATAFFGRLYRPENTDLIVAGDMDPEQVLGWIESAYGDWARATEPRSEVPPEPEQTELRSTHLDWPTPTAARLSLNWKAPGADPDDRHFAALVLAEDLLLSPVGPLQRRIVEEEGLAYAVRGGCDSFVDPKFFTVDAVAKDASHFGRIEEIVREELATLGEGVDPDLLERTRTRSRYQRLTSLDDPQAVASTLGWWIRRGGGADAIDRFTRTYESVTDADLAGAVATTFVDERLTRGTLVYHPAIDAEEEE
jgi:zinc protease